MSLATIRAAAAYFSIAYEEMFGQRRLPRFVQARFACYYIMRERDNVAFAQIGRRFGKDHTTILHGHEQACELLKRNPQFAAFINAQMALPKHSVNAAFLPSPFDPILPPAPPPPPKVAIWKAPIRRPAPKPVHEWEEVVFDGERTMRLDQHGYTKDDYFKRDHMIAGSQRLAKAIQQARAA